MNLEFLNLRRILRLAAAIAAVAAAAGVVVVAGSYAVYALARMWLTPAGSSAVVAALFALVAVAVAWLATRPVVPARKEARPAEEASTVERLIALAREQPLIALGAAAAAAVVLVRNPAVVTAVVSAFMAGNATKPEK